MKPIIVGLGSNISTESITPVTSILKAFDFLKTFDACCVISSFYVTDPVDCPDGAPPFVNAVAAMDWQGDAYHLLTLFKTYERSCGRPEVYPRNSPRMIDLDILLWGSGTFNSEVLTVPHPRMLERGFVLQPLAEIQPGRMIPTTGMTVQAHWDRIAPEQNGTIWRLNEKQPV